ncbi:MAG: hypothetical protein ACXAC2_24735 [Candidatus Kariarchaeaceae archaeon]|jgi:hypothetical protein
MSNYSIIGNSSDFLRKIDIVLLVCLFLFPYSCDTNIIEFEEYKLTIINQTDAKYDVWFQNNAVSKKYYNPIGEILPDSTFIYNNLKTKFEYTFRLVEPGGSTREPSHERIIKQESPDDIEWIVR